MNREMQDRETAMTRSGDPWLAPLSQLRWGMDRLFDHFLDDFTRGSAVATPALELLEEDERFVVRVEVPGVKPEDIEVNLAEGVLTISGEKQDESSETQGNRHYSERHYGRFERAVRLPSTVDPEHVEASHENGVLTVFIPKVAAARAKRIPVRS